MPKAKTAKVEETSTELVILKASALPIILTDEKKMATAIARIRKSAMGQVPDVSSKKGRDAIISLAYQVALTKAPLKDQATKMKADAQAIISGINGSVKKFNSEMDVLKDEIRKPFEIWKVEDDKRVEVIEELIKEIEDLMPAETSDAIAGQIVTLEALEITKEVYQEHKRRTEMIKDMAIRRLEKGHAAAFAREEAEALAAQQRKRELEELAAAKKRADEAERKAEEERSKREEERLADEKRAKENKRKEDEARKKEDDDRKAEADRLAQRQREDDKRRDAEMAELKRQLEEAKEPKPEPEPEKSEEVEDEPARETLDPQARARYEAIDAMMISGIGATEADVVVDLIVAGEIPHVTFEREDR